MTQEKLIARRVSKGNNEVQSRQLLREHLRNHAGDNLEFALVYDNFATEKQAAKFVAAL